MDIWMCLCTIILLCSLYRLHVLYVCMHMYMCVCMCVSMYLIQGPCLYRPFGCRSNSYVASILSVSSAHKYMHALLTPCRDVFLPELFMEHAVSRPLVEPNIIHQALWSEEEWWQRCPQVPDKQHARWRTQASCPNSQNAVCLQFQSLAAFTKEWSQTGYFNKDCMARLI